MNSEKKLNSQLHRLAAAGLLLTLLAVGSNAETYRAVRLNQGNPIITRDMLLNAGATDEEASNINGPSIIRVPDWLKESGQAVHPDANYYLYFGHHGGKFIRMAWAPEVTGPWTIYGLGADRLPGRRGVLDMGDVKQFPIGNGIAIKNHIASPDVWVDDANRRLVMYFHGPTEYKGEKKPQRTFVATSSDGLNFNLPSMGGQDGHGVRPVILGPAYYRIFHYRDQAYAAANQGTLAKAPDGATAQSDQAWSPPDGFDFSEDWWDCRGAATSLDNQTKLNQIGPPMRHPCTLVRGDKLDVFFTRKGDCPERIRHAVIDLSAGDWTSWKINDDVNEIMQPEFVWEGSDLPLVASETGSGVGVRQLRDPCVFEDNGRIYLFYSGRGEEAIGLAELEYVP